ncbi:MAG: AmmeMemoRadiSam system radical SAM enzyme [Lachnospiraceae bacterium]|nr:AmmeMemoRadiSam system radical SAM enzyme [Lachnospiraceae bacterium]
MAECRLCIHHCELKEGQRGRCMARICENGTVIAENYGCITSIALDPIEKKPLSHFYPGSRILSVGSYGCNLSCPFCQNHEISHPSDLTMLKNHSRHISPKELTELAERFIPDGNIGVAFTYNEPLVGLEYVSDCSKLIHERGLKTVLVTAGLAEEDTCEALRGNIDAMNIDLKAFTDRFYEKLIGGNRKTVMDFITKAVDFSHVELSCLIIPGENDSYEEMDELASWVASLNGGEDIPLHVSRFFPRYRMLDKAPTDVERVYALAEVAGKYLNNVYTGNC